MSLSWHPRSARSPRRTEEAVVQFGELGEPTYVDEAMITREEVEQHYADAVRAAEAALVEEHVDEVLQVPKRDRLPVAWPTGPLLDPVARKRAGERIAQERRELAALQDAGLMPKEEER